MAKKPAKPVAKPVRLTARQADTAGLKAGAIKMATAPDPQSGMDMVHEPIPTAVQVKKAKKEAVEAQFAEADAKADPRAEELENLRVAHQVRGF